MARSFSYGASKAGDLPLEASGPLVEATSYPRSRNDAADHH